MGYLLGLHLECGKLSSIDSYNRNLLFSAVRAVNLGISGSQNFSPRYLTEYGKKELNLYNPKFQLPNPKSPIYFDTQAENELYSVCIAIYSRYYEAVSRATYVPSYLSFKEKTFNKIWRVKIDELKIIFESTIQELEELKADFFEFKEKVNQFQTRVKISYYDSIIDLYELLKHKNKHLKPEEITATLEYCHRLYQVIATAENHNPYFQFFAHIIGLNYLNIYSKCSESEKITTKQRLKELIQFIKEKFYSYFSLNYLLLKTGYDSLDDQ
ncbi:hypothetical protein CONCODRAFT_78988 [Conidiobolus coronatus NRRL 28638]|uniref:Uncharacterized protein n=1 Tax=Conidiobolus coronatus (strain ATCC 28846 / CBS 209.66 / NRRL 28638) TaxID=796925 RepID=A0A137P585_CONC2|nr:hypothetical protein CONCODRAFT_78988 [Conidiobolus coronatus NRRL 28638]|eukprot:KXN70168.1 hypothetical protein CONCODRAFT_78988 [Conidiobolus coronatus NRRL 28638]